MAGGAAQGAPSVPTETRTLALADILVDPAYQIRSALDEATVARYVGVLRADGEMPPLKVGCIAGALVLLDGFHRVSAYRERGILMVEAEVVATTTKEARWIAAEANMRHGLPLKPKEKQEAFRAFVRAGNLKDHRGHLRTLREVAQRFGLVGHTTILRWLRKDFPQVARQYAGGDGGGMAPDVRSRLPSFHDTAAECIAQAVAAARGVDCRHQRGKLVVALRGALEEVERAAPFEINEDF
ncbi:hypothetical protein M0638_07675 [Roseomonas sp. NAR14]|uniref:ParB/Sulfiredoxin domain-containing protein n=1 Tax=Roseomonas acroporae TaxID=2937791 RepID=A0A9X1Y6X4_9PROT|nr:hypothetical protein [Roseomonas acroporae]MCK8784255.1 hypothetical protein [Roseomonas acroporae]